MDNVRSPLLTMLSRRQAKHWRPIYARRYDEAIERALKIAEMTQIMPKSTIP